MPFALKKRKKMAIFERGIEIIKMQFSACHQHRAKNKKKT